MGYLVGLLTLALVKIFEVHADINETIDASRGGSDGGHRDQELINNISWEITGDNRGYRSSVSGWCWHWNKVLSNADSDLHCARRRLPLIK